MTVYNKAQLSITKNAAYPTNNAQQIAAATVRQQQQDMIDSFLALTNPTLQEVYSDVIFLGQFSAPNFVSKKYVEQLSAIATVANQQPTALNTPLQVNFGAAQLTPYFDLSATGLLTFLVDGNYLVEAEFNTSRIGAAGSAKLLVVAKTDGVYTEVVGLSSMTDEDANHQINSTKVVNVLAGTTMAWDIIRDSIGDNSGGLFLFNPNLAGIPDLPTAHLTVYRYE